MQLLFQQLELHSKIVSSAVDDNAALPESQIEVPISLQHMQAAT